MIPDIIYLLEGVDMRNMEFFFQVCPNIYGPNKQAPAQNAAAVENIDIGPFRRGPLWLTSMLSF